MFQYKGARNYQHHYSTQTLLSNSSHVAREISRQVMYACQLSRLRVENFDLTPADACRPIYHAWLKNVSCCRLAWHNFQKYVNSDPCKERKPCLKWENDNTFLAISDLWISVFSITSPLADFGRLRKTSDFFGNLRKWSCRLQKSQHSQDKNLILISRKKLAGISNEAYNELKNRPQMVSISKLYLNLRKKIVVCLRVAHRKREESSH